MAKPDEEQSCSKLLLLNISNKPTHNEDLRLSCLENLECTDRKSIFDQGSSYKNMTNKKIGRFEESLTRMISLENVIGFCFASSGAVGGWVGAFLRQHLCLWRSADVHHQF